MTARGYMDEVRIRLLRHNLSTRFSDPEIMGYINRARRDVQRTVIGRYPHLFARISTLQITENTFRFPTRYSCMLPDDVIDVVDVKLNYTTTGTTPSPVSLRLRQASIREIATINEHSWTRPSMLDPVYTWQQDNVIDAGVYVNMLHLFIGGGSVTLSDYADNPEVEVWYTLAIGSLEDYDAMGQDDVEYVIPVMFEEMVILLALKVCFEKVNYQIGIQSVLMELESYVSLFDLKDLFNFEMETILLPSKEGI